MTSRLYTFLLCSGALALACGPRTPSADTEADAAVSAPAAEAGRPLATSLNVSVRGEVVLAFHVTNAGDRQIEIVFPTGQTHDFAVLDSAGAEVWRWSAGRMFTQALQNRLLDPRETLRYEQRWDPRGRTGTFTVVAALRSSNYPLEERVTVSVP